MTWSVSAARTWSRCQRQYYFDQIMGHHAAHDPLRQRAYFLGQLQNLALWQGKVVHTALQEWVLPNIRAGRWPAPNDAIARALELAHKQFLFSSQRKFEILQKADAGLEFCILAPHYFQEPLDPDALDQSLSVIKSALLNLLNSPELIKFLMERHWYRWEQTLFFKVHETTVQAQPDLVMPFKNSLGLDIVDWKVTTSSSNYSFQVAVYAVAARENENLRQYAKAGLHAYVVNLLDSDPVATLRTPYLITDDVIVNTINEIYESIERIRSLTSNQKYKDLEISRFEYANSVGTCALCNWRELCVEISDESPAKSLPIVQSKPTQLELPLG